MYWDVVEVKPESDYCLLVRFKDGLAGRVRLRQEELTGALTPLRDVHFFEQVYIDYARLRGPARSIWLRMPCTLRSPDNAMRSRMLDQ
jgi:hypothetical protein